MSESIQELEIEIVAKILKLLGDKTRLTIVSLLNDHEECCVCEFVEILQMSQPAVSQHLRKLRDANLVKETRKGQWIFYSINKNSNFYPCVTDLLKHVPDLSGKLRELEEKGLRIRCE